MEISERDKFLADLREHPRYRSQGRPTVGTVAPAKSMDEARAMGGGQRPVRKNGRTFSVPFSEFELFVSPQGNLTACPVRTNRLNAYDHSRGNVEAGADVGPSRDIIVQSQVNKGFLWVDKPSAPPDWLEQCADVAMERRTAERAKRALARKTTDPHLKQAAASGAIISQVIVDALKEQLHGKPKTKANSGHTPNDP